MIVPNPNSEDREFRQAHQEWHLDRLLQDIHHATQENFTHREQIILRGLLCDYSPGEIAKISFSNANSKPIGGDLNRIYERVGLLLGNHPISYPGKITSDNIRRLLQQAAYRK